MKKAIVEKYFRDYRLLEELWKHFLRLKETDFPRSREFFVSFHFALQRHLEWEKNTLHVSALELLQKDHKELKERTETMLASMMRGKRLTTEEETSFYQLLQVHKNKEYSFFREKESKETVYAATSG